MYVCRTLSYKGADFDIVGASLEERMTVKRYNIDKLSAFELLLFFLSCSLPIVLCHPSWSAQLNFWVLGPEAKGDGDGTFACMVENGYFCVLTNCNSTISIR